MAYVLGLDLGTSSLKGILMDQSGQIIATKTDDYSLETPQPGYSEQNPKYWLDAAEHVITEMTAEVPTMLNELEGISFSGQMHSLVLIDENGTVLRDAILWNDVRTTKQCQDIMNLMGEEILSITKNIALEGFTLPKILWVKENEPEFWEKTAKFLLPKDYLAFHLTNKIQMDYSDAAGTLLLDVAKNNWSKKILTSFDIPSDLTPELIESTGFRGYLSEELKRNFGFTQEVKIFGGGADNACAALGAGIVSEDVGMASIGTSGVFLSFENDIPRDYQGQLHLFNHVLPNTYYSMGVTLAAGDSLNWFKKTFAPHQSFDELLRGIEKINQGSDGLLFTPYIVGERTPYADSQIRGSFIGLDKQHNLHHFTRSVLEGITFSLRDSQELMENATGKQWKKIVSLGGGAKNKTWLQIQADVFNTTVINLTTEQGPGIGAAMLAAMGCGWFNSIEECTATFVTHKEEYEPIPENVQKYREIYQIYKQVYQATSPLSHQLQSR